MRSRTPASAKTKKSKISKISFSTDKDPPMNASAHTLDAGRFEFWVGLGTDRSFFRPLPTYAALATLVTNPPERS